MTTELQLPPNMSGYRCPVCNAGLLESRVASAVAGESLVHLRCVACGRSGVGESAQHARLVIARLAKMEETK